MQHDVLIVKNVTREGPGLLERVLKEHDITYELVDLDQGQAFPSPADYRAVVVLGGPDSANDVTEKMRAELAQVGVAIKQGIPFLGICLGLQVLVKAAGGSVIPNRRKEIGFVNPAGEPYVITLTEAGKQDPLFAGLGAQLGVFQLHGETVTLRGGMTLLATGKDCLNQVVKMGEHAYGFQSHLELTEPLLRILGEEDPDLRHIGADRLLAGFDRQRGTYTATGLTLFRNFLSIAGLL